MRLFLFLLPVTVVFVILSMVVLCTSEKNRPTAGEEIFVQPSAGPFGRSEPADGQSEIEFFSFDFDKIIGTRLILKKF